MARRPKPWFRKSRDAWFVTIGGIQNNLGPDKKLAYERFVDRYPDLRVSELKPFHAQQWVDSYPDLSVTSRRNYLRTIKRCLSWAVKQGYFDKSPLAVLEVPAAESREVVIEPEEFEKLLSFCRDENFRDLVVLTWETGCRPQESLIVEARHVDVAHQRWVFPRKSSKGKKAPRGNQR
jgi:integrase/recombinase XerD